MKTQKDGSNIVAKKGVLHMNILLCCAAGMSTSLLVTKMEKSAAEKGMKCKIWAVPGDAVRNHINDADVLLLGPQVRYMLPELKKLGEANHVPVGVINPVHYGTCNGEEVLKFAEQLLASAK
jgi:PTS system cellobiose-specific IIB component